MPTGEQMLRLAEKHINERYVNVLVPKNDPDWKGPRDCAEFMSWLVYQTGGFLYGCTDNKGNPATTEAYTGSWQRDSKKLGQRIPGSRRHPRWAPFSCAILQRPTRWGASRVSDGRGGTVEAMGRKFGVRAGRASGRNWDTGVLVPGFDYGGVSQGVKLAEPSLLHAMGRRGMDAWSSASRRPCWTAASARGRSTGSTAPTRPPRWPPSSPSKI